MSEKKGRVTGDDSRPSELTGRDSRTGDRMELPPPPQGRSAESVMTPYSTGRATTDTSAMRSTGTAVDQVEELKSAAGTATGAMIESASSKRGYRSDVPSLSGQGQPSSTPTSHVSVRAQPVDSGIMVLTRVRQKLQELVQQGILRADVHITELTVNGQRFLEVKAFMPYALFRNEEQRHGLYDSLENLGDNSTHVDAHIYRYLAD